ncbi:MAG TPA: hypothetical protein VHT26_25550 [Trebonia sp.]|nr:hypothetical protein [Trebonia sp.]
MTMAEGTAAAPGTVSRPAPGGGAAGATPDPRELLAWATYHISTKSKPRPWPEMNSN